MISVAVSAFTLNKEILEDVLESSNSTVLRKLIRPRDYSLKIIRRNTVGEHVITDASTGKHMCYVFMNSNSRFSPLLSLASDTCQNF